MKKITKEESLLLQSLATTSFLVELDSARFLDSDYFNNIKFANDECKNILKRSGLGNPATMQMMLYALLVIPKEILSKKDRKKFDMREINNEIDSLVEKEETYSKYDEDKDKIDYIRHIRNAISHSNCKYISSNDKNYIIFKDKDFKNNKTCSIKIECCKIGKIIMELQTFIIEYYNSRRL